MLAPAGRLDEDVAARHAALLHDVLDRKLGAAACVEFTDDGTFQMRSPWLDESANNRRAEARFLKRSTGFNRRPAEPLRRNQTAQLKPQGGK